jgi:integrase
MDSAKFKEYIKEKRPSLSKSSINTYGSILRSLHRSLKGTDDVDPSLYDSTSQILQHLQDIPPSRRKTVLSALVIVTDGDAQKKYRELMMDDIGEHRKEIEQQTKTPQQQANWVSQDEIGQKYKEYEKMAAALYKKGSLSRKELQDYQQYVILALLSGKHIVPRRAKDYVDMKLRNIDKDKDNYIGDKQLVFNSYKTSKTYGKQTIPLPTKLKNILKKWALLNPSDYLLIDSNMQPLGGPDQSSNGAVKLNQRLGRIFDGKKAGVNIMRHSYLTDKFGDTIAQKKKIEKTLGEMGSSANMLTTYVKEDSE